MPIVQNTAADPGQEPLASINVRISLITGTPNGPGYAGSGDILGTFTTPTDATGHWSATLTPNASITPANTFYQVVEGQGISNIVMPASGGPYLLAQLLVTPPPTPSAVGITGLQVAAAGTIAGVRPEINLIAGSGMTVSAVDNPGAARVDVTLASSGGGGGTPATTVQPGTSYAVAPAVGADTTYAREDHQHGTPSLTAAAPATTEGIGQAGAVGTAVTPARADHVHPLAAAATPGASAVGDTATAGSATTFAASDHRHGRETFAAPAAATSYGLTATTGTAATVTHSDHTHGTPALTTTAPATALGIGQVAALGSATLPALADHVHPTAAAAIPGSSAVGDTAATGASTNPAAADHRHAREAFGAVTVLSAFNTASANGAAATVAHSDHVHGAPALPAAAVGVAGVVTPPGGTTQFLRGDATWAVPAGGGAAYSRQIVIAADGLGSSVTPPVGAWTPTYLMASDTGGVWSGWVNISDAAQSDAVSFDFACGAGTYTIEMLHLAYTNRGIYTIEIDGVSVGTIDGYIGTLTAARSQLAGVVITAGAHYLTLLMATKNASSSGYVALVERLVLTRTA